MHKNICLSKLHSSTQDRNTCDVEEETILVNKNKWTATPDMNHILAYIRGLPPLAPLDWINEHIYNSTLDYLKGKTSIYTLFINQSVTYPARIPPKKPPVSTELINALPKKYKFI